MTTDMNITFVFSNLLIYRHLLPPPVACRNNSASRACLDPIRRGIALLHQASASCGRAFLCAAASLLLFASCEQQSVQTDAYPELRDYYAESEGWATAVVGSDSIRRFQLKLGDYVLQHPQAQESDYYAKIQQNVQQALLRVTIQVDDSWGEDRYITF